MSDQKKVGVRIAKVVDEVPSLIESDVIYIVRKGDGFDLHVSGSDGDIVEAYSLNAETTSREVRVDVDELTEKVTNLESSLDSKVDKQSGYGLSQENYTPAEKSKLSSLEGSKFKGEYVSLAALNAAQPSPEVGSYAYVDAGVGEVVRKYIWDSSDAEWVEQQGESASLTPAEVKSLYEENPDTNAFSDSEKNKLDSVAFGANNYTHPTHTPSSSGLYKITVDDMGHVTDVVPVSKEDITILGIPESDTTYAAMSVSEGDAGVSSKLRAMRADNLRQIISKIPPLSKTGAYTAVANDRGKGIDTTGDVTIPAGVFSVGDVLVVTNTSSSDINIIPASGVVLRKAGTETIGTITLSGYGMATMRMVTSDHWFISGAGIK